MARTAPVPNFPAIPGMNPGIFILGGGGDGGGSGAGGGKGKGKGQGAGGNNGGKDANGGGKGAGSCGAGSGGGCPNPAHGGGGGTHAGDPVDPVTGRVYTIPQTDLVLTGPLLFEIKRSYSTFAIERDVGLGFGWTHSLAWDLEVRRRTMTVHMPTGTSVARPLPDVGGEVTLDGGARMRRDAGGFVIADTSGLVYLLEPADSDQLTWRMTTVLDRAGNRLNLSYARQRLESLTDSLGRTVRVRRSASGHIAGFELVTSRGRNVAYRRYEHDSNGDLVATMDAEGRAVRFAYEEHRLVEQRLASGLCIHYRYDSVGRCIETWCDYDGRDDPALDASVPVLLADGLTRAKGVLHNRLEYAPDCTILYDSRQAKRFDTNAFGKVDLASGVWTETLGYDGRGELVRYSDPNDHVTTYERDALGNTTAIVEPSGARTEFKHDATGNVAEIIDALGVTTVYTRDEAGNLLAVQDALGDLLRCSYDARGLRVSATLPTGAATTFQHDPEANLVELTEPNGRSRRMSYDDLGRVLAMSDEEGQTTQYGYDACGGLRTMQLPNGATIAFDRDGEGRVTRYVAADGGVYELSWAGYNVVHEIRRPTGEVLRLRYDRECNLVSVENSRGEVHRIERDVGGRVVRERYVDGRERSYRLDAAGRLSVFRNALGEVTEIERDSVGRITKRTYDDGAQDIFEHDAVGRLLRADTESTTHDFVYDSRGNLIRETQACGAWTFTVESEYDAAGNRVALRTSRGGSLRFERDPMGLARRIHLTGGEIVTRTFDGMGREILRELPAGGAVVCRYGGIGSLEERRVMSPQAPASSMGAPAWVGVHAAGTIFAETMKHSPGGEIVERVTTDSGRTRFEYDAASRIVARIPERGPEERYLHEGGGRLIEADPGAPRREYGPGGALMRRGHVLYEYDREARRTSRQDEMRGARTQYVWSGRGLLDAVLLADGTRIENVYDACSRRLRKRIVRVDGTVRETHFGYSGDSLIFETTEDVRGDHRTLVEERTYVWDDRCDAPIAQQESHDGAPGRWTHHVLGAGNLPELLLDGAGRILTRFEATIWGRVEARSGTQTTPFRFPGQYFDDEIGLAYNRYRFYDPEVGLYINADPIGLEGSLDGFEYVRGRPFRIADPEGLDPVFATVSGHGITGRGASASARNGDPELHPIVQQALPEERNGMYPAGSRPPTTCAEPGALSNYIRRWEAENNGGRPLDPNNPRDRNKIQSCLGSINNIQAQHADGEARAPCPNCSQMLGNLRAQWGVPKERVIQPGASSQGGGDSVRTTPPVSGWR